MNKQTDILNAFYKSNILLDKIITQKTNNGGAISYQISDIVSYLYAYKLDEEIDFLHHLISQNQITQNAIEHLFEHLLFDSSIAKKYALWKREAISA